MKQAALGLVTFGISLLIGINPALACAVAPPTPPPPQTKSESDAEFATRAAEFRRAYWAEENARYQQLRIEKENELWDESDQVFIARAIKYAPASILTEYGHRVVDKIVTLKPSVWFKGSGSRARFKLQPISFNSCDHPGNGQALEGEKGDTFLVFAKGGIPTTRTVLYTIGLEYVESERSKQALASLSSEESE